jgi:AraC family transcriptional regulator of adaptative response/methylated-DNA-[protein]-cysteine methyltransferase
MAEAPFEAPAKVYWGCHDTLLGPLLMGMSEEGLCHLEFVSSYGLNYDLSQWQKAWPDTVFIPDSSPTAPIACQLSQLSAASGGRASFALYGAAFQLKVWKAMLQIAPGQSMSYEEVAALVGKPKAARAIGLAVEANLGALRPAPLSQNDSGDSAKRRKLLAALENVKASISAR